MSRIITILSAVFVVVCLTGMVAFADGMTTASRVTGAVPLGIYFDAVNSTDRAWMSNVIQPRGFEIQPVNCSGIMISRVNVHHDPGIGILSYVNDSTTLQWKAPGNTTAGPAIDVSGGGGFVLTSEDGQAKLSVWVDPSKLPLIDTNDNVAIVEGGDNADWNSFDYTWNFGDVNAGNWETGATLSDGSYPSKNSASGYIAAHVYENPGDYTVTLDVVDDQGNRYQYIQNITAEADPPGGWITYYFAEDGNDDLGDGTIESPYQSIEKAKTLTADKVKCLFKRGDRFDLDSPWAPAVTTFCVDAYGEGERPVFVVNGIHACIYGRNVKDARFMNLNIVGGVSDDVTHRGMYGFMHMGEDTLIMECTADNVGIGYSVTYSQFAIIQESETKNHIMGFWISSDNPSAVLGCRITDNREFSGDIEAPLRAYTDKLVVSHCHFERPYIKHSFRFMRNPNGRGRWYIASYNKMVDTAINPMHSDSDTLMVKHVLIENNEFDLTSDGRTAIIMHGGDWAVIRNNRLNASADNSFIRFTHGYNAYDFHYSNIYIYNNVMHSDNVGLARFMTDSATVAEKSSNFILKNNIFHAPNSTDAQTFFIRLRDSSASEPFLESSNNCIYAPNRENLFIDSSGAMGLSSWQELGKDMDSILANPQLADPDSGDFRLQNGSPCIDAGDEYVLPWVRTDFNGNTRPVDGKGFDISIMDIGAYEYGATTPSPENKFDVNGDEVVNVQDIVACVNIILGIGSGNGDVNSDGQTDVLDVMALVNEVLRN